MTRLILRICGVMWLNNREIAVIFDKASKQRYHYFKTGGKKYDSTTRYYPGLDRPASPKQSNPYCGNGIGPSKYE